MRRGLFIAFEGVEGAGKSTQAPLLAQRIKTELSREVVLTREPGGTSLAESLRSLVLDKNAEAIDERTEALIMAAARSSHVSQLIFPSLEEGRFVICDRFAGSYLAYQGFGRGLDLEVLRTITHFASFSLEPDLTFFLELDPSTAATRKGGLRDRIEEESEEFFERVARGYSELARSSSWITLDGSMPVEELHEIVFSEVLEAMQTFGER